MNKKDFLQENKRVLLIGAVITATLAIFVLVFSNLFTTHKVNTEEQRYNSSYVDPLPAFDQINNPVMYDYSQGTLGYHGEVPFENIPGYYYAIAFDTTSVGSDSGNIYVSLYGPTNVMPTIGSDYIGIKLDGDQWNKVKNYLMSWPDELSTIEGAYKVCALTSSSNAGLGDSYYNYYTTENVGNIEWCSIKLKDFDYKDSKFTTNYANENGIPTDWVRQYNDRYNNGSQIIENPLHTDFANSFYDKYNYHQIVILKKPDGEKEEFMVVGIDKFSHIVQRDEDGHPELDKIFISEDILNDMVRDLGYSIV